MTAIVDDHLFTTVIWSIVRVVLTRSAVWVALGGKSNSFSARSHVGSPSATAGLR
jgi:hypothetical protein